MSPKPNTPERQPRKATVWTKDKISHLIQLYHSQECLWNHYEESYKSKEKRTKAIDNICDTLRITKFDFGKKIHNLRNQFNSEMKKLERRIEESGGDPSDIGTPKAQRCRWEHFEALMFLRHVIEPRPSGFQGSFLAPKKIRIKCDNDDIGKEKKILNGSNCSNVDELPEYHLEETTEDENPLAEQIDEATDDFHSYDANDEEASNKTYDHKFNTLNENTHASSGNNIAGRRDLIITSLKAISNNTANTESNNSKSYFTCIPTQQKCTSNTTTSNGEHQQPLVGNLVQMEDNQQTVIDLPNNREHTTVMPARDQWDAFGELISNEFRLLNSDASRKKLKRKIMQSLLEIGEEDDRLTSSNNN